MSVTHTVIDSPVGDLILVAEDGDLTGLYFAGQRRRPRGDALGERVDTGFDTGFDEVVRQLGEYFAGDRTTFDLPLAPRGDEFDLRVWELLRTIPYGETRSYGDLARELGDPALAQAVGKANGRNPLAVVVPCHRVIGADGSLTGYAGGLDRKLFLLELEEPAEVSAGRLF
ncbi:MAG TPA: methylated-DNA--[protein]-cysteine S-methyltransferase [Pseudonocardiaceae bacterium]|nr:methylated-DNA--[protein]-cysteine S-methyltransferase [Pseudonocardiaceae bacterium]